MSIIFHIAQDENWQQTQLTKTYQTDNLGSAGFIHCSTKQQLVQVTNRFFAGQTELILLCIDTDLVQSPIKYEESEPNQLFPHIYGALNLDAVVKVLTWNVGQNGQFSLDQLEL